MSAFIPSTPLGVAMTSTSKPCFLNIPASRASQGTAMEPDSEVIATRNLRSGAVSALSDKRAVDNRRMKMQLKQNNS